MQRATECPECYGKQFYVVDHVLQPDGESLDGIHVLRVTTAKVAAAELGLPDRNTQRAAIGRFELWICRDCGLTHWYARDANAALEALRQNPANHGLVRLVDRT